MGGAISNEKYTNLQTQFNGDFGSSRVALACPQFVAMHGEYVMIFFHFMLKKPLKLSETTATDFFDPFFFLDWMIGSCAQDHFHLQADGGRAHQLHQRGATSVD